MSGTILAEGWGIKGMAEDARKEGQVVLYCLEGGPVIRDKDST